MRHLALFFLLFFICLFVNAQLSSIENDSTQLSWKMNSNSVYLNKHHKLIKVGINTSKPDFSLHIQGNQFISQSLSIGTKNKNAKLSLNTNSENSKALRLTFKDTINQILFLSSSYPGYNNDFFGQNNFGILWKTQDENSSFIIGQEGNSKNRLCFNNNGNIGIGTSSPSARFTVIGDQLLSGSLNIGDGYFLNEDVFIVCKDSANVKFLVDRSGRMVSKEVRVTLDPGKYLVPDFVFSNDYQLISIDSLSSFIKKNGFLPGIPSSDTLATTDVDLLELNLKLLQKIEELSLYIIELNNEISKLKEN